MTTSTSNRNLARELTGLATEVDSLTKSLVRVQEELRRELTRRHHFEREAADLAAAVAQSRRRATTAERELARLATEIETQTQTAHLREHELQTRLSEANQMIERLRSEVESKERQCLALETDLSDLMQNLRDGAAEAGWPSRTEVESTIPFPEGDSEPTQVGR